MSATDDAAAQIRALAMSENIPTTVLDEAYQRLENFQLEARAAMGETSQHFEAIYGSAQNAQNAVLTAIQACQKLVQDIATAAEGHARG